MVQETKHRASLIVLPVFSVKKHNKDPFRIWWLFWGIAYVFSSILFYACIIYNSLSLKVPYSLARRVKFSIIWNISLAVVSHACMEFNDTLCTKVGFPTLSTVGDIKCSQHFITRKTLWWALWQQRLCTSRDGSSWIDNCKSNFWSQHM